MLQVAYSHTGRATHPPGTADVAMMRALTPDMASARAGLACVRAWGLHLEGLHAVGAVGPCVSYSDGCTQVAGSSCKPVVRAADRLLLQHEYTEHVHGTMRPWRHAVQTDARMHAVTHRGC